MCVTSITQVASPNGDKSGEESGAPYWDPPQNILMAEGMDFYKAVNCPSCGRPEVPSRYIAPRFQIFTYDDGGNQS